MRRIIGTTAILLTLFLAAACSDGGGGEDANAPARRAVLASIGERAVLPTYRAFDEAAADLASATDAYAASLDPSDLEVARDAWRAAMEVWQQAELMQFGPAGRTGSLGTPGGQDLRGHIYSYPTVNPCVVDQRTYDQTYEDASELAAATADAKGLDAVEYLLFNEDSDNTCPSVVDINDDGLWASLSEAEIQQRRADYAAAAAGLVRDRAAELRSAWEPAEGDFLAELAQAGEGSTVYDTSQEALNAVSDTLFYLDTETKDMKVAVPAGISDCMEDVCLQALESDYAHASREHVRDNLRGFALVFRGGPDGDPASEGFDDLLTDLGPDAAALAESMNTELDEALAEVEGVGGTFHDVLQADPQPVRDVHAEIKGVTDLLKSQFLALLDLSPPASAPADTD
ncbi:MAG: imelysin family protein [Myxococcota bacterium]